MIDGSHDDGIQLKRVLGPFSATCVVVGAIIGVGIFFTPSGVAALAGSETLALVTWAVGGVIAMLGALTFAELGGMHARSGGQYMVLRDAYGPLPAFLFVFCNSTAIQAGAAAIIAFICIDNVAIAATGDVPTPILSVTLSAVLIVALAIANAVGVRYGSSIQNLTVVAKLATLLVVTLVAVVATGDDLPAVAAAESDAAVSRGAVAAIAAALVPAFFSFGGWQHALWIAGEMKRPGRDVPLAIVGGVLIVVVVYLLVNWAYLRLLGYEGVTTSQALAADAVTEAWPNAGRRLIAGAVAVSAFGVLNAQLLSGPRLVYGMARDGRFFDVFALVHTIFRTPIAAIGLITGMALILLVAAGRQGVDLLLTGVVFIDGLFFALTGLALLVLRVKRPDAERPFRVPLYPVVPLLFVAGEVAIVTGAVITSDKRWAVLIGVGWIVAALLCYALFFRGRSDANGASSSDPPPAATR